MSLQLAAIATSKISKKHIFRNYPKSFLGKRFQMCFSGVEKLGVETIMFPDESEYDQVYDGDRLIILTRGHERQI